MKKDYSWPASKLTAKEMELLYEERKRNGKPITVLIREAVLKTYSSSLLPREEQNEISHWYGYITKSKKYLERFITNFIFKARNTTMPETGSQQWLFTWADPRNQPCPVEIAVDWLCSSTHRPGNSGVGLDNKTPPQSFLISSSSEDIINTLMQINNRLFFW